MIANKSFWCSLIICIVSLAIAAHAGEDTGIAAITIPSADVTLSFVQPGRIAKVHVKEGNNVKAGELLVQQDDAANQAQLIQIKAQSEDTTQIEAAQASLDQKRVDLKKIEWVAERGSATELEVEHAQLDVKISELSLKVAQFEHEQNKRKYKEAQIRVDNMSLKNPIDGTVEKVEVEVGESVKGLDDVIRVVRTDPLWIDVPVPLAKGKTLKLGQSTKVKFPDAEQRPVEGKVIYISTVADAASATLRTRIEVPNKLKRPAGEHIRVVFSALGKQYDGQK
ncbi:MAG TPA: efflux RND transporter periplasmic adaptor subunit [Planctomycetes bacterium]|nr:efflux RND transporter periplasmic adaptor subunit [Planctomycetota bacterium]